MNALEVKKRCFRIVHFIIWTGRLLATSHGPHSFTHVLKELKYRLQYWLRIQHLK